MQPCGYPPVSSVLVLSSLTQVWSEIQCCSLSWRFGSQCNEMVSVPRSWYGPGGQHLAGMCVCGGGLYWIRAMCKKGKIPCFLFVWHKLLIWAGGLGKYKSMFCCLVYIRWPRKRNKHLSSRRTEKHKCSGSLHLQSLHSDCFLKCICIGTVGNGCKRKCGLISPLPYSQKS